MRIIVNHLYQILHAEEDVRFMNTYCGVPISYPGQIVEIGRQTVRFNTHPRQLYCMKNDAHTRIESNLLPRPVKASVLSVDLKGEKVLLGDFKYPQQNDNHHDGVRVEAGQSFPVVFWYGEHRYEACLKGISLQRITLYMDAKTYSTRHLHSGEMLSVRFGLNLPKREKAIIKLAGRIRSITSKEEGKTIRISLQIFPDEKNEQPLSRFIARRKKEILEEIHTLSQQALEANGR